MCRNYYTIFISLHSNKSHQNNNNRNASFYFLLFYFSLWNYLLEAYAVYVTEWLFEKKKQSTRLEYEYIIINANSWNVESAFLIFQFFDLFIRNCFKWNRCQWHRYHKSVLLGFYSLQCLISTKWNTFSVWMSLHRPCIVHCNPYFSHHYHHGHILSLHRHTWNRHQMEGKKKQRKIDQK